MVRALEDGWLYALGDVNRHALLTHQGKYQARVAGAAIAARAAGHAVPCFPSISEVWLRLLEAYRN